ncbi:MAG: hypothetical protein QM790_19890 [Nibricoccus sp.]
MPMLQNGKYQIATPGQSSRPMSLSEINLGLASGEVMPDDQYWFKGMPRWEKVRDLPGVILPPTPKARVSTGAAAAAHPFETKTAATMTTRGSGPSGTLSFWSQPEHRPRLSVWSPTVYLWLSLFFTPLTGTVLVAKNHRATEETIWRPIAWFWVVFWTLFIAAAVSLYFAAVPCGTLVQWGIGYGVLLVMWYFTCALPHGNFLRARSFEAGWRRDWGKPLGFGFLAWVVVATVYLLTRQS